MFNSIENIQWSDLKTANGTAKGVPDAIRGLISENEEIRNASYWKLDNHVVLQSDLYESAFYVLPFLFEILNSESKNGKRYVYDLLFEIANGYAPENEVCTLNGREMELTEACRLLIIGELNVILNEVSDIESEFRTNALELLIAFGDRKADIVPMLLKILENEDSDFSDNLKEAISELEDC